MRKLRPMKLVTEMELFSVNYYKSVSIEMNRKGHNTEAMESDSSGFTFCFYSLSAR